MTVNVKRRWYQTNSCASRSDDGTLPLRIGDGDASFSGRAEQPMEKNDPEGLGSLFAATPRVVNVGLEMFAVNLADHAEVVHVQWSPPAGGNAHLVSLLDKLRG